MKMTKALSRKFHEAKARKRMALPAPEYPPIIDYDKPVKRITIENILAGETNILVLYPSRKRTDMYRVTVNGKPWKEGIGYSQIMAGIRKSR